MKPPCAVIEPRATTATPTIPPIAVELLSLIHRVDTIADEARAAADVTSQCERDSLMEACEALVNARDPLFDVLRQTIGITDTDQRAKTPLALALAADPLDPPADKSESEA